MKALKVSEVLSAIRKQARRIKNGRSHFTIDEHADAIIALANMASEIEKKRVDELNSCGKVDI